MSEVVRKSIQKFYDGKAKLKSYRKDGEDSKYTMEYFDKLEKEILGESDR